jgi:hypothetical protein
VPKTEIEELEESLFKLTSLFLKDNQRLKLFNMGSAESETSLQLVDMSSSKIAITKTKLRKLYKNV